MLSIIIPFYNERDNLTILHDKLQHELEKLDEEYEVIYVDDGSTDAYASEFKVQGSGFTVLKHRKRMGKGQGLISGFVAARGDIIAFMDADLQNDPSDLPKFFSKIKEGYEFVNGVRVNRNDNPVIKFYSSLGNLFLYMFLRSPFTDVNCGFKMFRREVLEEVVLYANNFRFLPIGAYLRGFKVTQIEVKHHKRIHGKSKFGLEKVIVGFFDTVTAYFIYRFAERPLHFFGPIGGIVFLAGVVINAWLAYERIFLGELLFRRPALLLGILLIIVGLQIMLTGIIGELVVYLSKKSTIKYQTSK